MKTFAKVWISIGLIAIVIGLGVLVVAIASGARINDIGKYNEMETYSMQESYDGVESIQMEVGYGEVKVVVGETFSIDARNMLDEELESYVSDGVWFIKENNDHAFNHWGLRNTIRNIVNWDYDMAPNITVTIPKDFVADEFELHVGAGEVVADKIQANTGKFGVDAGRLAVDHIVITEKSTYTVGAGEMDINQMEAKNITVDCGVGAVTIEGTLTGDNDIKCGVGDVSLELTGSEKDYSYDVNAGLGEVSIDGDNFHDVSNRSIKNDDAQNYLNLDCGIGKISVEFN